jgi:hypothetical protein
MDEEEELAGGTMEVEGRGFQCDNVRELERLGGWNGVNRLSKRVDVMF